MRDSKVACSGTYLNNRTLAGQGKQGKTPDLIYIIHYALKDINTDITGAKFKLQCLKTTHLALFY